MEVISQIVTVIIGAADTTRAAMAIQVFLLLQLGSSGTLSVLET